MLRLACYWAGTLTVLSIVSSADDGHCVPLRGGTELRVLALGGLLRVLVPRVVVDHVGGLRLGDVERVKVQSVLADFGRAFANLAEKKKKRTDEAR